MASYTSPIKLTEEEMKECKLILQNNLTMLRKTLFLSQTELGLRTGINRMRLSSIEQRKYLMSWDMFTSLFLVFMMNESTNLIITKKKLFPDKLFLFFQCKREYESIDDFIFCNK